MKTIKYTSLLLLLFVSVMGCSGNYGNLKTQSQSDSKVIQQELINNWSDYHIWLSYSKGGRGETWLAVIVFSPKNDDRKILVGKPWRSNWSKVRDQEMWTEIVKANTTSDGDFRLFFFNNDRTSSIQEIWGPDNQLYGFIIHQMVVVDSVNVRMVNENEIHLSWRSTANGGNPL